MLKYYQILKKKTYLSLSEYFNSLLRIGERSLIYYTYVIKRWTGMSSWTLARKFSIFIIIIFYDISKIFLVVSIYQIIWISRGSNIFIYIYSLLIEFPTGNCIFKINSREQAVIKNIFSLTFYLSHDQSFRASLCSSSVIKYLKIYEIKAMTLLYVVQLNLKRQIISIYSLWITRYITDERERVWTFKSGLYFAISIDYKIVSEDASQAKPTLMKLSWDIQHTYI